MILGAGIAGIQAALDLADLGIEVHLIEREPSIGGRMAQLDKTFPTNDCSICILAPKMAECFRHPNITLHTYSTVQNIDGNAGNFTVTLLQKARYVSESACVGCGDCTKKCPVRVADEFDMGLRTRGAIYLPFVQALPRVMTIDKTHCLYLTRGVCRICETVCTTDAIDFDQQNSTLTLTVGSIIIATGFDPFDPAPLFAYGYSRYRNVVTALEYERLICASGPTGGHLLRPSDREPIKKLAFLQCVGSRDISYNPYCSSVCCMHSSKEATLAREHDPNIQSYIFYIDIRAVGKGFQRYITRSSEDYGIQYIRGRVAQITENNNGCPVIWYNDIVNSTHQTLSVDLVVLATSLIPRKDSRQLTELLHVKEDAYGFIHTHPHHPHQTSRDGIFVCGCCREPVDIPEAIAQASGAAAQAAEFILGGTL
jgi:heterodisulfide reductase subunit A